MKRFFALAICLSAAGCVKVPKEVNVNFNGGGSNGSSGASAANTGGWKDIAFGIGGHMLAAEHGAVFYAFDTLAYPNKPVDLAAKLQSARDLKGIKDVKIRFYDGQELVGEALTDGDGLASTQWTPPKAGEHHLSARIAEIPGDGLDELLEVAPSPLLVAAWDKKAPMVVIDLDHTLVDSSFFRVLAGGARPMADSRAVTRRIAEQYRIVYLTHRPDLLTRKSKTWLSDNDYPAGPLLVSALRQAFGDSGEFKTAKLAAVKKSFPNVKIGIGDKYSDAQAYVDNGLTSYLIPHYKDKPKDMRKAAKHVRGVRGKGRLQVVSNWRQIEDGIFKGRKYKPDAFAKDLERRANQLEAEEKRRKRDDDDDEDDDKDDD